MTIVESKDNFVKFQLKKKMKSTFFTAKARLKCTKRVYLFIQLLTALLK